MGGKNYGAEAPKTDEEVDVATTESAPAPPSEEAPKESVAEGDTSE